jgi:hypothetical protein
VFDELARLRAPVKIRRIQKIIIHTVLFAGPQRTRRAGDGPGHIWPRREQLLAQRRLSATGRGGDQNQERIGIVHRRNNDE